MTRHTAPQRLRPSPTTAPSSRAEPDPARVAVLERLYDQLPTLACKGLRQDSCSEHVEAADLKHTRARAAGVDLTAPTTTGACPPLGSTFGAGHCTVHPVRSMVCRLWGIAASMPCPHGCLPALTAESPDQHAREHSHDDGTAMSSSQHLSDAAALRSMLAVMHLGGHDSAAPGVAELLEACDGNKAASGLMARLMRGNATVKPALAQRLQQLRAQLHPSRPAPRPASRQASRPALSALAPTSAADNNASVRDVAAVIAPVTAGNAVPGTDGGRPWGRFSEHHAERR